MKQITQCPKTLISPRIWELIDFARDARHGAYPDAGGVYDQAKGFVLAARQIWAEEAVYKAPLMAKGLHLD